MRIALTCFSTVKNTPIHSSYGHRLCVQSVYKASKTRDILFTEGGKNMIFDRFLKNQEKVRRIKFDLPNNTFTFNFLNIKLRKWQILCI